MQPPSPDAPSSLVHVLRSRALAHPDRPAFGYLAGGSLDGPLLSFGELDRRARAWAALFQRHAAPGDRVLLLLPPGLEFVAAFFGCLYAGVLGVPAYPPANLRGLDRLSSVVADARPSLVLASDEIAARLETFLGESAMRLLRPDDLAPGLEAAWTPFDPPPDSVAFLQYTSGSTSKPKGVAVRHSNLLHNAGMLKAAWELDEREVIVTWLPHYHDMGLIGNLVLAVTLGARAYLMSPLDFLRRPFRWLEAISHLGGTYSGAPNFAYDLCLKKVTPQEREGLDLTAWKVAFNGSEPVRAATLRRFAATYGPCGLRPSALKPVYGLAEATLFVTGSPVTVEPRILSVESRALAEHRVAAPGDLELVPCGVPWGGQRVEVVDPRTGLRCEPDRVGEVWVSGASVTGTYWEKAPTPEDFDARLADDPGQTFLRTGDLGFLHDGQLVITGRSKDLLIFRGRNLYPQDLEGAVESCHPSLRGGSSAAFTVECDGEERPVVVAEVERRFQDERPEPTAGNLEAMADRLDRFHLAPNPLRAREVKGHIRQAIQESFEVPLHDVVLIKATTMPKTTSGKVQRAACRDQYLNGELVVMEDL